MYEVRVRCGRKNLQFDAHALIPGVAVGALTVTSPELEK